MIRGVPSRLLAPSGALALLLVAASWTSAQSDHSTAIRILSESRDFRVRARAAVALGSSADPNVVPPLIEALSDRSPAVRAAAATGLGRAGEPSALPALRRALGDSSSVVQNEARRAIARIASAQPAPARAPARSARRSSSGGLYPPIAIVPSARDVQWARVRYVVVLGSMENRSQHRDSSLAQQLSNEVMRNLLLLRGVVAFPAGQEPPEAERHIRRRRLPKLRLEGSLNRVERRRQRRELSVRCEVSILLLDDAGRNIRSVLNGAASGTSDRPSATQERRLMEQTLSGAVRSAMNGAPQAFAAAGR